MIKSNRVKIGDLEFDYRVSGERNKEFVILLHGFPETSIMWTRLMDHLATGGFYCVAPDMRGYSKGACPKGVKNYTLDKLSTDILNIAKALGIEKFHVIAHDWGAAIGWNIVYHNPDKIISWTALSVPHTRAFAKAYKTDPVQKKKSRYIGFFLLPILPEIWIRWNDFKVFRRLWKNSPPEELNHYLSVFRNKPCLTGALNYYRANLKGGSSQHIGDIETPTLFIWGRTDLAVGEAAARGTEQYIKGDYTFLELEGGHWLIQTNYDEVQNAIGNHLQKYLLT
jgi:pimeloyl-ACP methyl ester carboxylesterase